MSPRVALITTPYLAWTVINHALIDAIMGLEVGVPREVHAGTRGQPSINVVTCSSPSPPASPREQSEAPSLSSLPRSSPR